jgi:hypothetical protein
VSGKMSLHVLNQLSVTSAIMQSNNRRKYTAVSVAFIVFVTSDSAEQRVNIKFCAELEKRGWLHYIGIKTGAIISRQVCVWFRRFSYELMSEVK